MAAAARAYLLIGLLLCGSYVAAGGAELLAVGLGQACWIGILAGVRLNRPARPLGWYLLAGAFFLLALGDLVSFERYGAAVPSPSRADALYLAGDALLVAAILALAGSRAAFRRDLAHLVDAAVVGLALGLVLWAFLFAGAPGHGAGLGRLVAFSYPAADLALLILLVRLLVAGGTRTISCALVSIAICALILSDAWHVVPLLDGDHVAGTWRDLGSLLGYVLPVGAALHPSMRSFTLRGNRIPAVQRLTLLGLALVAVTLAEPAAKGLVGSVDGLAYHSIAAVMAAFVTLRMIGLVRALERSRRSAEESERRFRLVFEHSPIGISVGRAGMMSETNPALQRMLGYTGEELANLHFMEITHEDDRRLEVQAELDGGVRDAFSVDKRYVRKDGSTVETHVNVALDLEDGLGISLIEDVTARRELEAQVLQSQKLDAVGKLAGGVAHDFNNLMTAVIGYSDLLLRTMDGDVRKEKVEAIRESALRASDLTHQLLAFSGRQVMQAEEIDLRDVVIGADGMLRRLLGADVVLRTAYGDAPLLVRADRSQLEQVVVNLVANARDALPAGGTVELTVRGEGDDALLTVADTGVGMDDATRERVFEPFFTTKPLHAASGLGLSTVHGIVGQSGGSIAVESAPGEGAIFTVRLPRVPAPATLVD